MNSKLRIKLLQNNNFICKAIFTLLLLLVSSYAAYLHSVPDGVHAQLGHIRMIVKWSENMETLYLGSLGLAILVIIVDFHKHGHIISVAALLLCMAIFGIINKSHTNATPEILSNPNTNMYFDEISNPTIAYLPRHAFTMSPGERYSTAFRNTVDEAMPKLWEMTDKTAGFVLEKIGEAAVDPRFNWFFTGKPPGPETISAYKESIQKMTKEGMKKQ